MAIGHPEKEPSITYTPQSGHENFHGRNHNPNHRQPMVKTTTMVLLGRHHSARHSLPIVQSMAVECHFKGVEPLFPMTMEP